MSEFFNCVLHDNTSTGRIQYTDFHTGLSVFRIPRSLLMTSAQLDHANEAGVYFLFGPEDPDNTNSPNAVYVGQSKHVWQRLVTHYHNPKKDFFTYAILLTKSSVPWDGGCLDYLEYAAFKMVKDARRFAVRNQIKPPCEDSLPEPKRVSLDKDMGLARQLLALLGNEFTISRDEGENKDRTDYVFSGRRFKASGRWTAEGFVVLKGSSISPIVATKAQPWIVRRRSDYAHVYEPDFILSDSIVFGSPSAAASFVAGCSVDGWGAWKRNGMTLKTIEGGR